MYIIVGLGNPGEEYEGTRHNTGRIVLEALRKMHDFSEWVAEKKYQALVSEGKIGKEKVILLLPETFMNNSGKSLKNVITSEKKAETLAVVQDDLDLPLGHLKVSFNHGSGGHRGIESIIRAIKTEKFIRIRIGISPSTASGKLKKPIGGEAVEKHILGKFKKTEEAALKKVSKRAAEAISMVITDGLGIAMGKYNSN